MKKITKGQSREIYETATSPDNTLSNAAIGQKYGITERSVRHHIKKWERELHKLAELDNRVAQAIAQHEIDIKSDLKQSIQNIKYEIQQARNRNVSPEKLAPLHSVWLKALDLSHRIHMDAKLEEIEERITELENREAQQHEKNKTI